MRGQVSQPLRARTNQQGFTIVELMIATLVFSVILLVITVGVLQFTGSYYRGVHTSSTQNTTRSIVETVSQAIQFGSAVVTPTNFSTAPENAQLVAGKAGAFCAGGQLFLFTQGQMYTGVSAWGNLGLYVLPQTESGCAVPTVAALPTGGRQLLANRMRITNIALTSTGDKTYSFKVTVAYGDDDLLCTPDDASILSCASTAVDPSVSSKLVGVDRVQCKPQKGNQYCATARLQATVIKRVGT